MNKANNMTLQEIKSEISELPGEIETARAELAEIETANDQTKSGLDFHARTHSKLAMLEARLAALKAARPEAELEEAKAQYRDVEAVLKEAADASRKAVEDARELLTPIMTPHALLDAIHGTKAVSEAKARHQAAANRSVTASQRVLDVARLNGLARPNFKDI